MMCVWFIVCWVCGMMQQGWYVVVQGWFLIFPPSFCSLKFTMKSSNWIRLSFWGQSPLKSSFVIDCLCHFLYHFFMIQCMSVGVGGWLKSFGLEKFLVHVNYIKDTASWWTLASKYTCICRIQKIVPWASPGDSRSFCFGNTNYRPRHFSEMVIAPFSEPPKVIRVHTTCTSAPLLPSCSLPFLFLLFPPIGLHCQVIVFIIALV